MKTIAESPPPRSPRPHSCSVRAGRRPPPRRTDGKPILTIGLQQGIDNLNPIRGYTVAAFEAWNMQYATLTDKKAEDFSIAPGLAESWEGDGRRSTRTRCGRT